YLGTRLESGICRSWRPASCPGLFLSGPIGNTRRVDGRAARGHAAARNVGSTIGDVSRRREHFGRTNRRGCCKYLPVQWRMSADDSVEARRARRCDLDQIAAGEIRSRLRSKRTRRKRDPASLSGDLQPFAQRMSQSGQRRNKRMIVRAKVVVTMDGAPIENGAVAISRDRIVDVG